MIAHVIPAKRGKLSLAFFDYLVPPELTETIKVGQLVRIPLRAKEEWGVVKALVETTPQNFKLKTLLGIDVEAPLLHTKQLAFLEEVGTLYHVSLGFLLKSNLLPLKKRKLSQLKDHTPVTTLADTPPQKPASYFYNSETDKLTYLRENIPKSGQVLVLVPEVNDVAAMHSLVEQLFPGEASLVTSGAGEKEQFTTWVNIWNGTKRLVIGTRGAVFLPYNNLAAVIVDNEGHDGHKSWDMAPRYHAREAALMLARHHGSAIHLITHTPSVETYYFSKHNVYNTASTDIKPFHDKTYSLLTMSAERRGGNTSELSTEVVELLSKNPGSVFILCHRRGTMSYVSCRDCKTVLTCPNCKRSLTYHRQGGQLRCHHCNHRESMAIACRKCGGMNLALYGIGTDYIAREIRKLLPNDIRPIVVIDQDTEISELPTGNYIMVGTQLAWRYIEWEKLTAMVIADADTPLFVPEYRTVERLWLQMREALYRLPLGGSLLVQTNHPEHPIFQALPEPALLYSEEIKQRKLLKYPPYRYLLKIGYGHESETVAQEEAAKAYRAINELTKSDPDCTISSPFSYTPPFQKGRYWQAMLIKLPLRAYKKYWKQIVTLLPDTWKVDPNPLTIFSV